MRGLWARPLVVWTASVAAVAVVTFGVAKTRGVSLTGNDSPGAAGQVASSGVGWGDEAPSAHGGVGLPRPAGQVTVCVDYFEGVGPAAPGVDVAAVEAMAKRGVEAAMVELVGRSQRVASVYTKPSVVDIGCPSPPYPLVAGEIKLTQPTTIPSVPQPSYYQVFLFVLPSREAMAEVLGERKARVTVQENVCDGPGGTPPCWGVTAGAYVTVAELGDGSVSLARLMEQALGFAASEHWR